jgi:hypothetical protein
LNLASSKLKISAATCRACISRQLTPICRRKGGKRDRTLLNHGLIKALFYLCLPILAASFSTDVWHSSSDGLRDGFAFEPSSVAARSSSCQSPASCSDAFFCGSANSGSSYLPAIPALRCTSCGKSPVRLAEPGPEGTWACFFCQTCGSSKNGLMRIKGRCQVCKRRATFGHTFQKPQHCKQHRLAGELDTTNKRCHVEGCGRQPSFGNASIGVAVSCAAHKHDTFVNLKGRLCRHPEGCTKAPCFGFKGGVPLFCADHKTSKHVGLSQRARCQSSGCGKTPTFGDATARMIMFCKSHKRAGDVDLRKARCQNAEGCDRLARYGDAANQPRFCFEHHSDGQVKHPLHCPTGLYAFFLSWHVFLCPPLMRCFQTV